MEDGSPFVLHDSRTDNINEENYVGQINPLIPIMKEKFILSINAAIEVDPRNIFMAGNTAIIRFLTQCSNKIKFGGN
uniref:Uncharacterized protein n=1 Tax=Panagrolaimus davidi TaxID=227884 RepID=A0A914QM09_9BILA